MVTAIKGGWVVAWLNGQHCVLEGGTLVFEGNKIVFVGFQDESTCPRADVIIDATGKLVSPGLINLHCIANLDLQLLKIDASRKDFFSKPKDYVTGLDTPSFWTDQDFRTSADFSVATLLKSGTTTFAAVTSSVTKRWEESNQIPYALADASEQMGARAWLAHYYQEACPYTETSGATGILWDRQKAQEGLDSALEFIKFLRSKSNCVTGFLFPARTDRCSDDLLKETIKQARAFGGLHVRSHFSEYLQEYLEFKSRNPNRTMVEWLRDIEFLGPNVCLTHAVYIAGHSSTNEASGDDLQILADSGTSLCHCPLVIAREGVSMESFSRYIDAGINVGIGTDTFPPAINEEMRLAALIDKVINRDRAVGSTADIYNAATVGGAKALGREDLGKLAPGAIADISVFNLNSLETGPIDDPIRTFVHTATGRDCDTVIVDGRLVVSGGQVVGVDEEALARRAQESWLKLKGGVASWDWKGRELSEWSPSSLPLLRNKKR